MDANEVWNGWGSVIFVVGGMTLTFALAMIVAWQMFGIARAKVASAEAIANEEAYRRLAERLARSQDEAVEELASMKSGVEEMRTRLGSIEQMLKAVE